jgi:hypothetical protein
MWFVLIKEKSPEWDYIWDWLKNHPINKDFEAKTTVENKGEVWQYLGSYCNDLSELKMVHTFRHRAHPKVDKPIEIVLRSSDNLTHDQIQTKQKIKF